MSSETSSANKQGPRPEIILIGPIGAGKTTQAQLLGEKLGLPRRSMDLLRWPYMREVGWDEATEKRIQAVEGWRGVFAYRKPFEAHLVERLLDEERNCTIDFGGSQSVYEDPNDFARVRRALDPFANVVLLLPSPDLDESVRVLKTRVWDGVANGFDFHEHFVKHPSNRILARFVVYTRDRTPEQTRDEILARTAGSR